MSRRGAALIPMLLIALCAAALYGGFGLFLYESCSRNPNVPQALVRVLGAVLPQPGALVANLAKVTAVFLLAIGVVIWGTK